MFDCSVIPTGHYLFIETSFRPKGWKAWLIGPKISPQAGKCFQFWYHMYGNSIGELNVYLMTTNTVPANPDWSRQQNQGNQWYIAQVSITQSSYVNVSFCLKCAMWHVRHPQALKFSMLVFPVTNQSKGVTGPLQTLFSQFVQGSCQASVPLYFTLTGSPLLHCCPAPTSKEVRGWSLGG